MCTQNGSNFKHGWFMLCIGVGLMLTFLGMGGCGYMWSQKGPIVIIKHEVAK